MIYKSMTLNDVGKEIDDIVSDFLHQSFEKRQEALVAGATVFKEAVEQAAPKNQGNYAQSFEIKTKYKDKKYVGNTKTVNMKSKKDIPLSNLLEYGEKGKPHIREAYDAAENQIYEAIVKTLEK